MFLTKMVEDLRQEYNVIWDNLPIDALKAAYLDPRTKFLPAIPKQEMEEMLTTLHKEYLSLQKVFFSLLSSK
jgi:hypothetical protein